MFEEIALHLGLGVQIRYMCSGAMQIDQGE